MSASILEQMRAAREDIEVIEKAISKVIHDKKKNPKLKTSADRCVKFLLNLQQDKAAAFKAMLDDEDGMRREEANVIGGGKPIGSTKNTDVWMNFYEKMRGVKEHHRKHYFSGANTQESQGVDFYYDLALQQDDTDIIFSGEEKGGSRVDLQEVFNGFMNLKKLRDYRKQQFKAGLFARMSKKNKNLTEEDEEFQEELANYQPIDYITWLKELDQFHNVPRHIKYRDMAYQEYLEALLAYLKDYVKRSLPLVDRDQVLKQLETEFGTRWEDASIPGWNDKTHKMRLFSRPTNRLFANEGAYKGHTSGKQYKKALANMQKMPLDQQKDMTKDFEAEDERIAKLECEIQKFKDLLNDPINVTIEHLTKKQSKSAEEILADAESDDEEIEAPEEAPDSDDEVEEDERPIYNPLNLPLGWDGKPIPYWLYKLHGLGKEFKCQICGNYSYWGRRAFERHFSEWRHTFGMKCLKIPNTAHFKEITQIDQAVELYEKLKKTTDDMTFKADVDVECEDAQGNVMSQKAYDDLQRQGLW